MDAVTGRPPIPAMTKQAERECYYRLALEAAGHGETIEFGAWLGASSAYIAAAMRDSGTGRRAHVYDKFQSKPGHVRKVREFYAKEGFSTDALPVGDAYAHFLHNLGPLADHVVAHRGEIGDAKWDGGGIALIVNDAPKRVPAISAMLANFASGIRPGTVMAWQDFCHFPSYEIPACLYRLRGRFEFVEAIVPGTTLVFRVTGKWSADEVTREALALANWTVAETDAAWSYWLDGRVPESLSALFRCGQAMFLCDIGRPREAIERFAAVLAADARHVAAKWRYLREARADFVQRYAPLFDLAGERGLFEAGGVPA